MGALADLCIFFFFFINNFFFVSLGYIYVLSLIIVENFVSFNLKLITVKNLATFVLKVFKFVEEVNDVHCSAILDLC